MGEIFRLSIRGVNPQEFPREEFLHYSIPAWDETGGPVVELGKEIESGKLLLSESAVLVSKLNPRIPRVRRFVMPADGRRSCASTEIMPFIPMSPDTSIGFYAHYFGSERFRKNLVAAATGTTNSHQRVRPPETLKWIVPSPPPPEQAAIASILDAVDTALERTRAAVEQARELKRAILQRFFYEALGETAYADRPRKTIPRGWRLAPTRRLLSDDPKNGLSPESSAQPPGVPTFSIAAIRDGRVDLTAQHHLKYTRVSDRVADRYQIQRHDVLIVRGNANSNLVGKAGMVDRFPGKCIYPDITMRVVFRTEGEPRVCAEFAVLAWNHAVVHNQVLRRAKTSNGTLKINSRDVNQIVMPVPPDNEQRQLVTVVAGVDSQMDALISIGQAQEQLKRALMHDLLTGRLRVLDTLKVAPS